MQIKEEALSLPRLKKARLCFYTYMGYVTLFLISLGLCFDTFAASVSCGLLVRRIYFWQAIRIAAIFAVVQAAMPAIGWLLGRSVAPLVAEYDHWLAFLLLGLIGGKMIYESLKRDDEEDMPSDTLGVRRILAMAVATSIDALIVGVSFALIQMSGTRLTIAILILAMVTGTAAMLGMLIGKHSGSKFEKWAELAGGVILILIGVKVLLEHTVLNS